MSPRRVLAAAALGVLVLTGCEPVNLPPVDVDLPAPSSDTADGGAPPNRDYDRDKFGSGWADADGDGCDTRDEILARDALAFTLGPDGCVEEVTIIGPYTGERIEGRSGIDIDHVVALCDAWESGAWRWSPEQRRAFANDPHNLLATQDNENQRKGCDGPDEWRPPVEGFWCEYATIYEESKARWKLHIVRSERFALDELLATCPTGGAR